MPDLFSSIHNSKNNSNFNSNKYIKAIMKEKCKKVWNWIEEKANNVADNIRSVDPLWYALAGLFLSSVSLLVLAIIVLFSNNDCNAKTCCNDPALKSRRSYRKKK